MTSGEYSEFKGWDPALFGRYTRYRAAYFETEFRDCLRLSAVPADRKLVLLELGFGHGSFLSWGRDRGHIVRGVDVERPQILAARAAGFEVEESVDALDSSERFDGIFAFDVLEHIPADALRPLMLKLAAKLRPGGWLLARVPNGDSPYGRANQHGDLTHVTALGSTALRQIGALAGLTTAIVRNQAVPVLAAGPVYGTAGLMLTLARALIEIPAQVRFNLYYPGRPRWYSLGPNLVAIFVRPTEGASGEP